MFSRLFRSQIFWMVVVAFALRNAGIIIYETYNVSSSDTEFHFGYEVGWIAKAILDGKGFANGFGPDTGPTAIVAPVYPYLVAAIMKVFGTFSRTSAFVIFAINSLFSALTCWAIVAIADRVMTRKLGLWAGWLFAVVPFFMRWPTTWIWEISLSTLLLTCLVLHSLRLMTNDSPRSWFAFGALWGFSALTNPALLAALPFTGIFPAYKLWRDGKRWFRAFVISSVCFFVVISPWILRNRIVFGEWVFIRGNFPLEFRMGNYHGSNWMGWRGYHPTRNPAQLERFVRLGERAYFKEVGKEGYDFVKSHPGAFMEETGKRFYYFWNGEVLALMKGDPYKQWMYWPLSLLGWIGWLLFFDKARSITQIRSRLPAAMIGCVMLFYPSAYYITFVQHRYRHPIEPLLLLCAVYLFWSVGTRVLAKRES